VFRNEYCEADIQPQQWRDTEREMLARSADQESPLAIYQHWPLHFSPISNLPESIGSPTKTKEDTLACSGKPSFQDYAFTVLQW